MSPHETPSVSIDGHAIRRIREEKRLTQFYLANVIGVTIDTVSRWENNRYPTIRRDNALNLAEALDVGLEEILRHEEEPVEEAQAKVAGKPWSMFSLFLLLLIVGVWFLQQGKGSSGPVLLAERLQPRYAAPGSRILVRVQIFLEKPLKGMIIKEQFPPGWKLIDAVPPVSSLGNQVETARWMLRNPPQLTTITYLLEIASSAESGAHAQITGEVIANPEGQQSSMPISTAGFMQVEQRHWADTDGNQVIDDMEILEISDLLDGTDELRSEWERIEEIWDAGGYRWDVEKERFVPIQGD